MFLFDDLHRPAEDRKGVALRPKAAGHQTSAAPVRVHGGLLDHRWGDQVRDAACWQLLLAEDAGTPASRPFQSVHPVDGRHLRVVRHRPLLRANVLDASRRRQACCRRPRPSSFLPPLMLRRVIAAF